MSTEPCQESSQSDRIADQATATLLEAALAELRLHRAQGDPISLVDFLECHPALRRDPEAAADLLYQDYILRARGDNPALFGEYVRQFPEYAEPLRRLYEADHLFCGLLAIDPPEGVQRRFGNYELLDELGRGGMGVVYKARQVNLDRVVALKLILAGRLASEDDVQRFHKEAEAAARLQHPHIVAIHEVGEIEGQHYFSMDYIEGQTLEHLVRENPLPGARAARYVEAVARAVHHAHAHGILHRDLKPANVLIDASDQPRITDFGLARKVDDDQQLTGTGQVLGTPSYMPPEQASGQRGVVGPVSDVYALGATLYELLTGRPPFKAESPFDTLLLVMGSEPVTPQQLNPRVPRDLETICLKCLQKDPRKRYATAGDLADDLGRFLRNEPIHARPVGRVERGIRWCRRNPVVASLLAVIGAATVGLAVATAFLTLAYREAADQRDLARKQRDKARDRLGLATSTVDHLLTNLSQSPEMKAKGVEPLRKKMLEEAAKSYESFVQEDDADPEVQTEQGFIWGRLGQLYRGISRVEDAERAYEQARIVFERLTAAYPPERKNWQGLANSYHALGRLHRDLGRTEAAEKELLRCLEINKRLGQEHPEIVEMLPYQAGLAILQENLGELYRTLGRPGEAEKAIFEALKIRKRLVEANREDVRCQLNLASSYRNLANYYVNTGRPELAEESLQEAVVHCKLAAETNPDDPECQQDLANCYNGLAFHRSNRGQPDKAEEGYSKAIDILKRLADNHPSMHVYWTDLAGSYCNLGNLQRTRRDLEASLKSYDQAVTRLEVILKKEPKDGLAREYLRNSLTGRASAFLLLRRFSNAAEDWSRAIEFDNGEYTGVFRISRAGALAQAGDHARALAEADEWAKTAQNEGLTFFRLASVYAPVSAAIRGDGSLPLSDREQRAEEYAVRAMDNLRKAAAAGLFNPPEEIENLRQRSNFDPLRSRQDFQDFLKELSAKEAAPKTP